MATSNRYELTPEQLEIVEQAMHHDERPVARQRSQAIYLLHKGHRPGEVAEMMNVTSRTIYNWYNDWQERGQDGLVRKPGGGRPEKATPAYCQLLDEVLAQEPAAFGYDFAVWTIDRLREHMAKETQISMSAPTFGALLKRQGYVYRRPKHDLKHLQDPDVLARAELQLEELKKKPSTGILSSSLWTKRPSN